MINKELQKRILSSIVLIPIVFFFIFQGTFFFGFFLSIFFLASSYEWIKMNKLHVLKIIGVCYLFLAFLFAYFLKEKFTIGSFILVLIICIFTDLGGYIFGKVFKGPKLTKISPKKTYAGALGGFILSLVAALIYLKYTATGAATFFNSLIWTDITINKTYLIFVLVISFISQIGDLIISYFKRLAKVKDTGNLLPGHGGILDRLDGIVFAIPFSYLFLSYLK